MYISVDKTRDIKVGMFFLAIVSDLHTQDT